MKHSLSRKTLDDILRILQHREGVHNEVYQNVGVAHRVESAKGYNLKRLKQIETRAFDSLVFSSNWCSACCLMSLTCMFLRGIQQAKHGLYCKTTYEIQTDDLPLRPRVQSVKYFARHPIGGALSVIMNVAVAGIV
jgi:hypothetical protein